MTHALRPEREPVAIAQTHLPVAMETDQFALDHVMRMLAEAEGLDPLSVRDIRTQRVRSPGAARPGLWAGPDQTFLTVTALADRR